jgi:hypothetical protein
MSNHDQNETDFDPASLIRVETIDEIAVLPPETEGVFVYRLTDEKLQAITARVPRLRYLVTDGSTRVTDSGLAWLDRLDELRCLDLEWSDLTDAGLPSIAALRTLRWVDLGFCGGITRQGLAELRRVRPDLEIVGETV